MMPIATPDPFTAALAAMPFWLAALCALGWNVGIFAACLLLGEWARRAFRRHRVSPPAPPLTGMEVALAVSTVLINTLITAAGMALWRWGWMRLLPNQPWRVLLDSLVLFFAMDFGMYGLHRAAHHRLIYPLIHLTHHQYENPRPLTLFALNPLEVLGFGGLWLLVIVIYPAASLAMVIYLTLNVAFGLIGHLGVEPMPAAWLRLPGLRFISTSTFHAEHHGDKQHNFGFYTLIWDRLFGTLSPEYERDFSRAARVT